MQPSTLERGLAGIGTERAFGKGGRLLAAGTQAQQAGIVIEGVLGEFYESSAGARKAKWLAKVGNVCGSLEDLVRRGPARATIEALTPSRVIVVPYAAIREQALGDFAWTPFFVSVLEDLYRRKSEREYTLLMLKAHERYAWFRDQFGELEEQLSQETVASYLGITPVHLSRIRASQRRPKLPSR